MKRLVAVAAAFVALSCGDSTSPGAQGDLITVNVLPDAIEIVNVSHQPVYYFVTERNWLALINWAPCSDPDSCEGVPTGGKIVVPNTEIGGYFAGAHEAVVHHWHLVRVGGASGFQPDSIRSTIVQLHAH